MKIKPVNLSDYDHVVVSTSGGKDSQAMLWAVCKLAAEQGVLDRVVAVHCDLGRVEWAGTRELAETQARMLGVRFVAVKRAQGDLLTHVETRGKWPDAANRYCTSDHKRAQVDRVFTEIARATNERLGMKKGARPVKILSCMGERAQESKKRQDKLREHGDAPYRDPRASNTIRHVDTWHPIGWWTTDQVWEAIRASGLPHHRAYDVGMPRLSCCFCILSSDAALMLAAEHNPDLLAEYVRVEQKIGHQFRHKLPIANVQARLRQGERARLPIATWGDTLRECGG